MPEYIPVSVTWDTICSDMDANKVSKSCK